MTKDELCRAADEHCDISMLHSNPGHGQYYHGYSSVKTLVDKGLVIRSTIKGGGGKKEIWLTDSGTALAREIKEKRALANQLVNGNGSTRFDAPSVSDDEIPAMNKESFVMNVIPKNWNVQSREKNKKPR